MALLLLHVPRAPTPSAADQAPLFGRRAAVAGLCAAVASPALAAADECLSCKLKSSLRDGGTKTLAVGADVGAALLATPQRLAVTDVVDVGRDTADFDATMRRTLARHDAAKERVLVWVQSELVDGIPWCPDTRAALPLLESALYRASASPGIVLVTADVVRGEYVGTPGYPYRQHPQLRLEGVPTLYRWGVDGPVARLQERQITPAALDALLR